jgi:hypothetical protein
MTREKGLDEVPVHGQASVEAPVAADRPSAIEITQLDPPDRGPVEMALEAPHCGFDGTFTTSRHIFH